MQKSQSDVRSQFIVELTHALSVWNFVLNIYEQYGFRRKVPLGEQYIFVSFLNADEITVSVHTGISCFEIEDISAGFHGEPYLGEEEPRAGTIGGSLYLFGRQPNSTFRITPEELLKTSILEIKNSFGSFALPYLDGFQTIFDVWRNLYTPSSEITLRLLRTMPTHGRIERAII